MLRSCRLRRRLHVSALGLERAVPAARPGTRPAFRASRRSGTAPPNRCRSAPPGRCPAAAPRPRTPPPTAIASTSDTCQARNARHRADQRCTAKVIRPNAAPMPTLPIAFSPQVRLSRATLCFSASIGPMLLADQHRHDQEGRQRPRRAQAAADQAHDEIVVAALQRLQDHADGGRDGGVTEDRRQFRLGRVEAVGAASGRRRRGGSSPRQPARS